MGLLDRREVMDKTDSPSLANPKIVEQMMKGAVGVAEGPGPVADDSIFARLSVVHSMLDDAIEKAESLGKKLGK